MKSIKLLFYFLMVFTISACSPDPEPGTLDVSPSSITFGAEKSSTTIRINSNSKWKITGKPSWINIAPLSGENNESVEVTCDENTGIEERTASFMVLLSDGSLEKSIEVKQSGKEISLSIDVTSINLPSIANASQSINIKCNSSWTISGNPEWLQISSNSGNGNSSIVVSSRSSNESSKSRTATLTIASGDKTVTVMIEQEPALSACISTPSNVTTLYYAVIFNLTSSSDVATTKLLLISDYDYKHKTEAELITAVGNEESEIPESETIYTRGVEEDTKYHILTISYDKKGNRGEMVDIEFVTPKFLNSTDDAWCIIDGAGLDSSLSLFLFSVVKKGRCATYDVIYGANIYPGYLSGSLMAFEINYYKKNKKKNWLAENWELKIETNYPNDNIFYYPYNTNYSYGGVIATTWGMFSDGTRSSDIYTVAADTYSNQTVATTCSKEIPSEIEWIQKQNGWIKTSPRDFKK